MQNIALKKSTIAAMNQAYQSYREQISRMVESGLTTYDEVGGFSDINSYVLMVFTRQIIQQSGEQMTAGKALLEQAKMQIAFQQLDDD